MISNTDDHDRVIEHTQEMGLFGYRGLFLSITSWGFKQTTALFGASGDISGRRGRQHPRAAAVSE